MSHSDARGIAVSAPSAEALEGFEAALRAWYSFRGEPLALLDPLLARWPEFGPAHLLRALVLIGLGERRFNSAAERSLNLARQCEPTMTERERRLIGIAYELSAGRAPSASRALDELLREQPLDILSLHLGHSLDFDCGDPWNLRNRICRVLPHWRSSDPGYANVLAMCAFGHEECNQYPDAERYAREALELDPENPWAVHALAHVLEMCGRVDEGVEHLRTTRDQWATDSPFAYHNWWHLALFHLDRDDTDTVLALYDEQIDSTRSDFALAKLDATSLLWRLDLLGMDTGDRFRLLADWWREALERECGHNAFHDFHAALAFSAIADLDSLERMQGRLAKRSGANAGDRQRALSSGLVDALTAFAERRYAAAAEQLTGLRDEALAFGGSHAQRDVITLTLITAAARAGNHALAECFLNERLVSKPASPLGWRLKERLRDQSTRASA